MLSILIPCYNYNCYKFVYSLHLQCKSIGITHEIIVAEDGGTKYLKENNQTNQLVFCKYVIFHDNVGRARNINRLLKTSQYNLKLILDCDLSVQETNFIKNYVNFQQKHKSFACFGGITYKKSIKLFNSLRYNYGIKRENKIAEERSKKPYKLLFTSNILLKNCPVLFNSSIRNYGYEDMVFSKDLQTKGIKAIHIDNPLIHHNVESNKIYFSKTEQALQTLIFLEKKAVLKPGNTRISKIYNWLSTIKGNYVLNLLFSIFSNTIENILIKKGRPIWLLDVYKLLYFSKHY